MGKVINAFIKKVPCTSKMKKIAGFNNKNNQVKLILELRKEFLLMTEYNCANKRTIDNIFSYLAVNITSDDYLYLKNIINALVRMYYDLDTKLKNVPLESNLEKCYINILYNIKIFEKILAKRLNRKDANELEKIISFENISYLILEKRNIDDAYDLIDSNIDLLNYYNYEEKDFEHLLFEKYVKAKLTNDINSIFYYTRIINHILHINSLNLNKEKFIKMVSNTKLKKKTELDKKLQNTNYDNRQGRFILEDDLIVSIDKEGTKNIDDALSIDKLNDGGFIIGIHIADICSILPDYNIQNFTFRNFLNYSYSDASLKEKIPKNAISMFAQIDKNGKIIDYRIVKSNIYVYKNLFHHDVKKIINKNKNDILSKFIMDLKELYMMIDESHKKEIPAYKFGSIIVEKFMILFGSLTSKYFYDNNLPYIYSNDKNGKITYSLNKSKYNTGFKSDNLKTYGKATSPIVDNVSKVNQLLIHKHLFDHLDDKIEHNVDEELGEVVKKLNLSKKEQNIKE